MLRQYIDLVPYSFVLFLTILTLPLFAHAEIPQTMNFQGYLKASNSVPVNGNVGITFSMWNTETGGAGLVWSETLSVNVKKGLYSVILGQTVPLDIPFDVPYFLGIMVGNDDEMTPRQPLTSVPYALSSGSSSETDPTVPEDLKDGVNWSEVSNRPSGLDDGDDVGIAVEVDPEVGSNVTGYIPKWTGAALAKGTIFDNGNVGVGTAAPNSKLEVAGMIHSTSGGVKFPDGTTQVSAVVGGASPWHASGGNIYYEAGKVAIGKADPGDAKLHIEKGSATVPFRVTGGSESQFMDGSTYMYIAPSDTKKEVYVGSFDSEGSETNLIFNRSGNVGIGASPHNWEKFAVLTNESGLDGMVVRDPQQQSVRISPNSLVGQANALVQDGDAAMIFSGGELDSGNLVIAPWATGLTAGLRMTSSGDLGIGTSQPKGKVHIRSAHDDSIPKVYDNYEVDIGLVIESYQLNGEGGWKRFSDFAAVAHSGSVGSNIRFLTQENGDTALSERLRIVPGGHVGVGTANPLTRLHIRDGVDVNLLLGKNPGYGSISEGAVINAINDSNSHHIPLTFTGSKFYFHGAKVGIGTTAPAEKLHVNGNILASGMTTTTSLKITGGADIAEPFKIKKNHAIKPGMVVSIDPENPGELKLSDKAYDHCVAGIVSGAGGINTGMIMSQTESEGDNSQLVALTGRAYCYCDASNNSIRPGDLLTSSEIPGHAMKVVDFAGAQGAVIGKAMTPLNSGKGLVLVLVALQ